MNWTDEYREIVEFYYWEPQHIGRAKGIKRFENADDMYNHINKMEVSLNHILNIFFSLFPICKFNCFDADESHEMMSAWQLEQIQREQKNATQPDLFFQGKTNNIAIELKIGSKSSLEQINKYIKFNAELPNSKNKDFKLVFLTTQSDIKKIFNEKYESISDINQALVDFSIKPPKISFITYDVFYKSLSDCKIDNQIEQKLISSLKIYLSNRLELKIFDVN